MLDEIESEGLEMKINARAVLVMPWLVLVALTIRARCVPRLLPVARPDSSSCWSAPRCARLGSWWISRLGRAHEEQRVFGAAHSARRCRHDRSGGRGRVCVGGQSRPRAWPRSSCRRPDGWRRVSARTRWRPALASAATPTSRSVGIRHRADVDRGAPRSDRPRTRSSPGSGACSSADATTRSRWRLRQAGFVDVTPDEYRTAGRAAGARASGRRRRARRVGRALGARGGRAHGVRSGVRCVAAARSARPRASTSRRERIRLELYTVNQLLAMHVRTGAGPIQATQRIVDRGAGVVVDELRTVLASMRNGVVRTRRVPPRRRGHARAGGGAHLQAVRGGRRARRRPRRRPARAQRRPPRLASGGDPQDRDEASRRHARADDRGARAGDVAVHRRAAAVDRVREPVMRAVDVRPRPRSGHRARPRQRGAAMQSDPDSVGGRWSGGGGSTASGPKRA